MAAGGAGNFVVAWESDGQDGSTTGIFGQRFDGSGAALGSEFQINTYTTRFQTRSAVAADGAGNFVVAWGSVGQDGSTTGIFAAQSLEPLSHIFSDGFESGTTSAWSATAR